MVGRARDALELLLPDASVSATDRARRVTTFVRLLCDDAQPACARSVSVTLERACGEFQDDVVRRLRRILVDLLRHHLNAALDAESFAWFGKAERTSAEDWARLEPHRRDHPWLAQIPAPGEPPQAVAERLLASLAKLHLSESLVSLWGARIARVARGPGEAEHRFRKIVEASPGDSHVRAAAVAGVAECLLDRGAVARARRWLEDRAGRPSGRADRGTRLLVWSRLLTGDVAAAFRVLDPGRPWTGRLPSPLAELRDRRGDWLPFLCGVPAVGGARALPDSPGRADLGASVLGLFALRGGTDVATLRLEVAPGLRDRCANWLSDRGDTWSLDGEAEHSLFATARTRVDHRADRVPLDGTLGGEATCARALVPVTDRARGRDGCERGVELVGWIHLEFEHHLVPSLARLECAAKALRSEVLAFFASAEPLAQREPELRARDRFDDADLATPSPTRAVFELLIHELGIKMKERRWWGFDVVEGRPRLAAEGGSGLPPAPGEAGGARALERALLARGAVAFETPDPELSIHASSTSGVVIPLFTHREVCGLVAIESVRRRDFRAADVRRLAEGTATFGLALRVAQFSSWHQDRFGCDVWFDARQPGFARRSEELVAAGRSRSAVTLSGPPGSGKRVLARWLHFESGRRDSEILVFHCGSPDAAFEEEALFGARRTEGMWEESRGSTLLLHHVHALAKGAQFRLLERWIAEDDRGERADTVRFLATCIFDLAQAVEEGSVLPELGQRLDRLQLRVPPLGDRREDIPRLVELLCRRFAGLEHVRAPKLRDEALALLWRQPWEGNVRELENFVYKLVLFHRGEAIGADDVRTVAERFRLELIRRIPSRNPRPCDLRAAVATTCTRRGTPNKSRAAAYLGWDPDTLKSRLDELDVRSRDETGGENSA